MSKQPKLRCVVCGCRRGYSSAEFVPAGEWKCCDCGSHMKVVKTKKPRWVEGSDEEFA